MNLSPFDGLYAVLAIPLIATAVLAVLPGYRGAALLNVLAGRLSRVVDRAQTLERLHPASTGPEHDRHVWELRLLDRRITIINLALFLAVASAVATCLVVALLFVGSLTDLHVGPAVAVTFILAMVMLIVALTSFMIEVRVSLRAIHVRADLLR